MRARLTGFYAVPFLLTGTILLAVPLLQTRMTRHVDPTGGPLHPAPQGPDLGRQVLTASALALLLMALVAVVLGWLVAGRFLRPLRTITATARDISATNLHRRLAVDGRRNEFTELAATLNDLFGRLEAAFVSQRNFVANASHELRTPLTAERTLLQVALADPDASVASLRATCEEVLTLGQQQERLIDALLTLATGEQGVEHRETFDLAAVAREVVSARRGESSARGITVDARFGSAPVSGDPRLVESLLANLMDNALRHNFPGGTVGVSVSAPGVFRIENTGAVIAPADLSRLFEPFQQLGAQRVRPGAGGPASGGYGLGLAIVRAIAQAHGATLRADPRPGGGLTIEVQFAPGS